MSIRRIKIVIDTESLKSGAPVGNCVYMVAPSSMSPYNQGQDELGVTVNQGDTVIWSPCGFDPDTEIKLIQAQSPGVLDSGMTTDYNDDGTVTAYAKTKTINNNGATIYRFAFTVDDQDFSSYTWDPFIKID